MPLTGFLPASDTRIVSTVEAIRRDLTTDGLVLRYETNDAAVLRILREIGENSGIELSTRLQLDSIQALRVLIELEKHFDLEIDEEQIFDGWFDTGELICRYMAQLASGTPAGT